MKVIVAIPYMADWEQFRYCFCNSIQTDLPSSRSWTQDESADLTNLVITTEHPHTAGNFSAAHRSFMGKIVLLDEGPARRITGSGRTRDLDVPTSRL